MSNGICNILVLELFLEYGSLQLGFRAGFRVSLGFLLGLDLELGLVQDLFRVNCMICFGLV